MIFWEVPLRAMPNTDSNFDAKFGMAPPEATLAPPLPVHVVLLGQVVVCAAILLVVQPPFVTVTASAGGVPTVCPTRVVAASLGAAGLTYLLHACGAQPADAFRGTCELLYRSLR